MNLKILSKLKKELKKLIEDKEILDIIIFGSVVKGKAQPRDIDIALITEKEKKIYIKGYHISIIRPNEFFTNPPMLANTLLREGYSIKHNKPLSEVYNFKNRVLFKYDLAGFKSAEKVKIVNILHGKNKGKGMVEENGGEWLANQVFILPIESEYILERFLINSGVKFKKYLILMH